MHGVARLPLPPSSTQMAVFGPQAVVVASAHPPPPTSPLPVPVATAVSPGRGRILVLPSMDLLAPQVFHSPSSDAPLFLANGLRWLAGDSPGLPSLTPVGFPQPALASLSSLPHVAQVDPVDVWGGEESPQEVPILCLPSEWPGFADPAALVSLQRYVHAGGGLLLVYNGPVAPRSGRGPEGRDWRGPRGPANDFGAVFGFVFTHQPAIGHDAQGGGVITSMASPEFAHVGAALDALSYLIEMDDDGVSRLPQILVDLIDYFAVYLPLDASLFPPALCSAVWDAVGEIVPSLARPVYKKDVVERLAVLVGSFEARAEPGILPQAKEAPFPGPVPITARPVSRAIDVTLTTTGWYSTGLYAPPGSLISARLSSASVPFLSACVGYPGGDDEPEETVRRGGPSLLLRIGAHSDVLFHAEEWRRAPALCCTAPISLGGSPTLLHNPYGGLVYIEVRDGNGGGGGGDGEGEVEQEGGEGSRRGAAEASWASDASRLVFEMEGCIDAPYYVAGQTSESEWRAMHTHRVAPWGELASSRIIFTLPSAILATISEPGKVLAFWDRVVDLMDVLSQRGGKGGGLGTPLSLPRRPERVVGDVQLAFGTLHNGYPICCSLPSLLQDCVDLGKLRRVGAWAMFKTLGYNFQASTLLGFDNMADVGVHLYPLFVYDTLLGISPLSHPRLNVHEEAVMDFIFRGYDEPGAEPLWGVVPEAGAHMYVQLVVEFGWELFFGVFDSYVKYPLDMEAIAADPPAMLRDQWVVRLSQVAKRDLCPFFKLWGVCVSKEAVVAVSRFPEWLPSFLSGTNVVGGRVSRLGKERRIR